MYILLQLCRENRNEDFVDFTARVEQKKKEATKQRIGTKVRNRLLRSMFECSDFHEEIKELRKSKIVS